MTGVDDRRGPGAQVDASDLAGHEAAVGRVVGEPLVGQACLLGESDARPPRVAQTPDHESGEQGGSDLVAHGVGHREVQHAPLQREVKGVAADVAGRFQPARERELPSLARVRARQQTVLDLGGERKGNRALAPLEEVGEPAVGDDDVPQGVRGERDLGQHLFVRRLAEKKFEHTDRFPAVGHRREHARPVRAVFEYDRLGGQRAPGRASHQRHPHGGLLTLRARGRGVAGVAEPDQRVAAEVRDEKRNLAGVQFARKPLAEDVGSGERRSVLNGREQLRTGPAALRGVPASQKPTSAGRSRASGFECDPELFAVYEPGAASRRCSPANSWTAY